jgi:Uma2 family endonuclease
MVTTTKFTRADYMALPEGYPAELLDGMLVKSPSPTWGHQHLVTKLAVMLWGIVGPQRIVVSPIDVFVDEHNVLQPDVLVTPEPRSPVEKEAGEPLLVVEVLSPSTKRRDRERKPAKYFQAGAKEVWIVDPQARTVEVLTPAGRRRFAEEEEARSEAVPGFALVARDLFAD